MFHACFTWLGIILPSPHCFHRCNQFSKRSTQICHCFPILFPLFIVYPKFQTYGMKIALLTKFGQKLNFCTSHDMCVISSYRNCNFSIAFPLRDNGPTSEPQFYLASFYPLPILSTVFPRVSIFQAFYSNFPLLSHFFPLFYIIVSHFFHCFSHHFPLLSHFFPIVLCHIPSFFHCFSHHFPSCSPPFPFFSHCFISYSLIFSSVPHIFVWGSCFWFCIPGFSSSSRRLRNKTHTNLTYNNFTHTNLTHTNLTYNSFTHTNLTHTNLTYNNFTHTHKLNTHKLNTHKLNRQ